MKKILSLALALAMMLSLSVPAIAAEVNNNSKEVTAKYVMGTDGGTIYSVDVTWGNMQFTYTAASKGTWNPETHVYDGAMNAAWSYTEDANKVTVTNHSNTGINVDLTYNKATGYDAVTGTFDNSTLTLANAEGTEVPSAPTASALLTLSGDLAVSTEDVTVGTVTVTLNK